MTTSQDYFKTICEVNRAFGSTLEYKALLDLVVEKAVETMEGKAACLFLADKRKDVFVAMAQKGLSPDYLHTPPGDAKKLVEEIVKEGHLAITDATTDPRVTNHEAKKKEGIASMLVVPVMVRGKAIGVIDPLQRQAPGVHRRTKSHSRAPWPNTAAWPSRPPKCLIGSTTTPNCFTTSRPASIPPWTSSTS